MKTLLVVCVIILSGCGKSGGTPSYVLANGVSCKAGTKTSCGYVLWHCTDNENYSCENNLTIEVLK